MKRKTRSSALQPWPTHACHNGKPLKRRRDSTHQIRCTSLSVLAIDCERMAGSSEVEVIVSPGTDPHDAHLDYGSLTGTLSELRVVCSYPLVRAQMPLPAE